MANVQAEVGRTSFLLLMSLTLVCHLTSWPIKNVGTWYKEVFWRNSFHRVITPLGENLFMERCAVGVWILIHLCVFQSWWTVTSWMRDVTAGCPPTHTRRSNDSVSNRGYIMHSIMCENRPILCFRLEIIHLHLPNVKKLCVCPFTVQPHTVNMTLYSWYILSFLKRNNSHKYQWKEESCHF